MDTVMNKIINSKKEERLILGIDGLSRSGKTTFTDDLRKRLKQLQLNFITIHIDDHIVNRKKRYATGHEEWYEYYTLQWDIHYLRDYLFAKIRKQNELQLLFYNSELDEQVTRTALIPDECIVLIEGVFLQRQEWREFFDYIIYLDCPKNMRFSREAESTRKDIQKFNNRYWKAEDYYMETVNPLAKANLVISTGL
ncbi:AAA family ATPase [Paenibacillus sp. sptzw28]|uniref:kinase n=1 Tax=Paenibacillus sp. sptzw28 TaxID=715179 RepID=UPI001C6ECC9E|nr:kinase [Paenibacillus sp. sptzw28]QYR24110.1 AAA family ATPase [Paenibacillus sp. sptzw28]